MSRLPWMCRKVVGGVFKYALIAQNGDKKYNPANLERTIRYREVVPGFLGSVSRYTKVHSRLP